MEPNHHGRAASAGDPRASVQVDEVRELLAWASGAGSASGAPAVFESLVRRARTVAARAHAPYSRVRVGACLVLEDGRLFDGCNVESASFGLTQCAERAALCAAVAAGALGERGDGRVAAVVLASSAGALAPCGACRQVLSELAPRAVVASSAESGGGAPILWTVRELLPDAFRPEHLGER